MHDTWTLQAINEYNISQCVPLNGTATYAEISQKSGLELDKCRRIIRYVMTNHVFYEPMPEHVAHTALSALAASKAFFFGIFVLFTTQCLGTQDTILSSRKDFLPQNQLLTVSN